MKLISRFLKLRGVGSFFEKRFRRIEKRLRFIIAVFSLSFLMMFSTFFYFDKAFIFIPILIVATYFFTYFSLLEDIKKIEWIMLFLMPLILTITFYLFYFLFPGRWLTRLPFIIFYAISIYAILLTSNIFNVGVEKSLALYRPAFSVNFFYQIVVIFFIFNIIFSFHQGFLINGFLSFITIFLLAFHLLWTVHLKIKFEKEIIIYSLFLALIVSEITVVFSLLPVPITVFSLLLAGVYYSLTGLTYNFIDKRLFPQTIREFLLVLGLIFVFVFLSIRW